MRRCTVLAIVFLCLFPVFSSAAPGQLDPAFGVAGIARSRAGDGWDIARAVAVQPDGKLVVAGYAGTYPDHAIALARYRVDGTLDPAFGEGGRVLISIGGADKATAVAIQPDGRIVVAGVSGAPNGADTAFALARFDADGSLDASFGTAGIVVTQVGAYADEANALVILPDGRLVVAGRSLAGAGFSFCVARYLPGGALDPSFNGTGIRVDSAGTSATFHAVASQPDGRVVAAGILTVSTEDFLALSRFNADGTRDATFGTDGLATWGGFPAMTAARAVAVLPDGRILAAGAAAGASLDVDDFAVVRFDAAGVPDATFGSAGIATVPVGAAGTTEMATAMTVLPDGRILLAGQSFGAAGADFALARLHEAGETDTTFGVAGRLIIPAGGAFDGAGLAPWGDGSFVIAGSGARDAGLDFAVAKLQPSGAPDPSFGGGTVVYTDFGRGSAGQWEAVAIAPGGGIVAAGIAGVGPDTRSAVGSFLADGSPDAAFGANGAAVFDIGPDTSALHAIALQPDGRILVAGDSGSGSGSNFALARLLPDGSLDTGFGNGGKVVRHFPDGGEDSARAVAVQVDGKVVVAGYCWNGDGLDFAVVRHHADGSPDLSFGTAGVVITPIGVGSDRAFALAFQPDGKIVVAGSAHNGVKTDIAVVRYTPTGLLDATFGAGGKVTTSIGTLADDGRAVVVQPDGRIVVAGSSLTPPMSTFTFVRYLADGALDTSFGVAGVAKVAASVGLSWANALARQADGRLVAAGVSQGGTGYDFALVRVMPTGSLDAAFGSNGIVVTPVGSGNDTALGMALQADGKAVVAGGAAGLVPPFTLARYLLEQTPDAISFAPRLGVTPGSVVTSDPAIVGGVTGTVPIQVSGGSYSIGCVPGAYTAMPGSIANGASVCVRHVASAYPVDMMTTTLVIGTTTATFSSTTAKAAGAVSVSSSASPSLAGSAVTFTATVSGAFGPPTGSVVFKADGAAFGAATLGPGGTALAATSALVSGVRMIVVEYGGDVLYAGAASAPLAQVVDPATSLARPAGDFSGDRKADLVWRDADGGLALWTMEGTAISATFFGVVDAGWQVVAVADADGDGKSDLFWWNPGLVSGYLWFLDGPSVRGMASLGSFGPEWRLLGSADFNGDGRSDALFRRSDGLLYTWLLDGGTILAQGSPGSPAPSWQVADLADFDGDGKADILMRSSVDGSIAIWKMDGVSLVSSLFPGAVDPAFWNIAAAADFDADGKADLLWQGANGDVWVWLMDGGTVKTADSLGNLGPGWRVRAVSDFTGDGKADVVWRFVDGTTYLWIMDGASIGATPQLPNPGGTWEIVTP